MVDHHPIILCDSLSSKILQKMLCYKFVLQKRRTSSIPSEIFRTSETVRATCLLAGFQSHTRLRCTEQSQSSPFRSTAEMSPAVLSTRSCLAPHSRQLCCRNCSSRQGKRREALGSAYFAIGLCRRKCLLLSPSAVPACALRIELPAGSQPLFPHELCHLC